LTSWNKCSLTLAFPTFSVLLCVFPLIRFLFSNLKLSQSCIYIYRPDQYNIYHILRYLCKLKNSIDYMTKFKGLAVGKTGKTVVLPAFCEIEHGSSKWCNPMLPPLFLAWLNFSTVPLKFVLLGKVLLVLRNR
jgi:hypothetical protein